MTSACTYQYLRKADVFLLMITFCALVAYAHEIPDKFPDYECPTDCQCVTMPEKPSFAVRLVCYQNALTNLSDYGAIPSQYTTAVTLICAHCQTKNWIANDAFSHLSDLEELEIFGFHFTSPITRDTFRGMTRLKTLFLSSHSSGAVCDPIVFESADTFVHTPQLEYLNLYYDTILQFPDRLLCPLNNLKSLNMSINCIQNISDLGMSATNCSKSLEVLDLTANLLLHFPGDIYRTFPNLHELYLGFNRGIVIPSTTFHHLDMRILNLEFIGLKRIGPLLLKGQRSLLTLKLGGNKLQSLPSETFRDLSKLEELDLQSNQILSAQLESGVFRWLPELKALDLSGNKITILKEDMFAYNRKLTSLILARNNLVQIRDFSFKNLAQLHVLDLSHNSLTAIPRRGLQGLYRLQKLDLTRNLLIDIKDGTFNDFKNTLKTLNLSSNRLQNFPEEIGLLTSLQLLDLIHNQITSLPNNRNIYNATNLLAIRISHNRISSVARFFFSNKPVLSVLNLGYNRIDTIEQGVFDQMPRLQYLVLRNNNVKSLSRLFYRNPKLTHVDAAYNNLTRVDSTYLPNGIILADFSSNMIKYVPTLMFLNFPKIRKVDLRFNKLEHLELNALQISNKNDLTEFLLSGNPFYCTCNMAWIKDVNERAYMMIKTPPLYGVVMDFKQVLCWKLNTYNGLTKYRYAKNLARSDFLCKFESICLSVPCCSGTPSPTCQQEKICPANCTCYNNFVRALRYVNCDGLGLSGIPDEELSWATNVSLANNEITELNEEKFKSFNGGCPEYLYLQNNMIKDIAPNTFRELACVKVLRLDHNQIAHLAAYIFTGLRQLRELDLQSNLISSIDNRTFHQIIHLEKLQLHDNRLVSLPEPNTLLPSTSMKHITLSGNPWTCGCDFAQKFRRWLILHMDIIPDILEVKCTLKQTVSVLQKIRNLTNSIAESNDNRTKLIDMKAISSLYPKKSLISQNESLMVIQINETFIKVRLASFNIENYCYLLENLTVVHGPIKIRTTGFSIQQRNALISTIIIFICLIITTIVVYTNRMEIKVWIFTRYGRRPFYYKKDDFSKPYDAYISYSDKQLNFVIHELLPKLEQESPHYKLHVRARDDLPGGVRANDIISTLENSCRTIAVLSENYVADEWCLFEFQRAHYNALHSKMHSIIVVLLHDVKADVDKEIQLYIKTGSYMRRDDKKLWQKIRYALPDTRKRFQQGQNLVQLPVRQNLENERNENLAREPDNNEEQRHAEVIEQVLNNELGAAGWKKNKTNNIEKYMKISVGAKLSEAGESGQTIIA